MPEPSKKTNIIMSLITLLRANIQTALPIFMMNLLSCILSAFVKNGLSVPIILWITGEPGAGKTQLAMYLGTFYNKSRTRNDRQVTMNRLRANASTKLILKRLKNCRDNVFLLDDIKAENSTSLKEHSNTNVDTTVRGAYDQNSEGIPICCNAIITGEYVASGDSTLARLILLPLKNFREAPQNLKTLKDFQENGFLVTDFMILFIQWICQELNEESFMTILQEERERHMKMHMDKNFSARSGETLATLSLGLRLLEDFCISNTSPSFHKEIQMLVEEGGARFLELVKNTSFLHGDKAQLYADILSNIILKDESIRSVPEITYKGTLNYFNYCAESNENGIYIQNPAVLSNDPYFMVSENCQPYLLIRQNLLEEFPHELENYCMRHGIPASVYTKCKFSHLADLGLILVAYNRSDNSVNQIVKYPSIDINKRKTCMNGFYCINLQSPLFEKLRQYFSKKESEKLNVFPEHTEESFYYNYGDEDDSYGNAETYNFTQYKLSSAGYIMENVQKAFQNIFHYRYTKG